MGADSVRISLPQRSFYGEDLSRLKVQAMGIVSAPVSFVVEKAQQYDELPKISEHFKSVRWDSSQQQLFVVTEALGWQARMILKLNYGKDSSGQILHSFEVIWGSFQGLKGQFTFVEYPKQKTQLILSADYAKESLPLPRILMGMALEVIVEQVAQRMRRHLESSYRTPVKKNP